MDAQQHTQAEIEKILELLAQTPNHLTRFTQSVEDARLHHQTEQDSWSAQDILAHLRACADVWGKGIQTMLVEANPKWRYVSPRTWIGKIAYPNLPFRDSLQVFCEQRRELLITLSSLKPVDWSRTALVDGRTQTVYSYARRMALHEQEHCHQLAQLLESN